MDDLVTWLPAQLDDDEREWLPLAIGPVQTGNPVARRMLAEVEAKRRILARHRPMNVFGVVVCLYCGTLAGQRPGNGYWPCPEILDAALPYADRPGYRDEWRPEATGGQ